MNKYICQNCGQHLVAQLQPTQAQEVNCGTCSAGFFIPWTESEQYVADTRDAVLTRLVDMGIDPTTVRVESHSFGETSGRRVVAASWTGTAEVTR